jgi:hypothetical protein
MTDKIRTGPTKEELLADFTSHDAQRIWSATWAVIKTRDADALSFLAARADAIEAATNGVELGGAFTSNRASLTFALRKLAFFASGAGCLCALYPENLGYDPERERDAGHVSIVDERRGSHSTTWTCACTVCGKRYEVQDGESHFTYWEWTPAPR